MTILDSSVWVALFNEEDSQHRAAEITVADIKDDIFLPQFVIAEVCTVLTQNRGKATANLFIERGLNATGARLWSADEEIFTKLVKFYYQSPHPGLSFVDAALLFLSSFYPVITFDKKLAKAIKRRPDLN
ncbi:MAG: type II toxin-antitoxin system VapC family toxin [Candidatus Magasanikbacteria bacterium]|nr:type II toxin-antitoxin system VapC family toxin [Candidatus Magasanikbacteria bacterium]